MMECSNKYWSYRQTHSRVCTKLTDSYAVDLYKRYFDARVYGSIGKVMRGISPDLREPIEHTIGSYVVKDSVAILDIGNVLGAPSKTSRDIAASVDFLFILSLMKDDIIDGDERRDGQPSAWKKFGIEKTEEAIENGLQSLTGLLRKAYGDKVAKLCKSDYSTCIQSMSTQRNLNLGSSYEEIIEDYNQRGYFRCRYPLLAFAEILKMSPEDKRIVTLEEGLRFSINAAQIYNDLRDFYDLPERPAFSDIRNGLVSIPVKMFSDCLTEDEKKMFMSFFGNYSVSGENVSFIKACILKYFIIQRSPCVNERLYTKK